MKFEHDDSYSSGVNIKVVGVGGGGNNAVKRMIASDMQGVDFVAINTDKQVLRSSEAYQQLVIGEKITGGLGAGANPLIGSRAAEESLDDIKAILADAHMVFLTAGMGGGTGTGAIPVVARLAREMDILTVAVVTKPFIFEGTRRMNQALEGIAELSQYVDALIVIPNEKLKQVADQRITLRNAFEIADSVLGRGIKSISDLVCGEGFINLDFADVCSVMKNAGYAHMGVGSATGKDKAQIAAEQAISSPLLESSIKGATGVIISMSISPDVGLEDVDLASTLIHNEADPDANVIWGVTFNEELEDEMKITIIATGFDKDKKNNAELTKKPEKRFEPSNAKDKVAAPYRKINNQGNERRPQPSYQRPAQPAAEPVKPQTKVADADVYDELEDLMNFFNSNK